MAGLLGGLALLTRMGKISGASVVGLASGIACICGIRGLGKQASARLGNTYSLAGVTCGLAATGAYQLAGGATTAGMYQLAGLVGGGSAVGLGIASRVAWHDEQRNPAG